MLFSLTRPSRNPESGAVTRDCRASTRRGAAVQASGRVPTRRPRVAAPQCRNPTAGKKLLRLRRRPHWIPDPATFPPAQTGCQSEAGASRAGRARVECPPQGRRPKAILCPPDRLQNAETPSVGMSADAGRGRDGHYWPPPAQTRAGATNAHGSHLGDKHARPSWVRTYSRRTGVADVLWHSVQHRPCPRESPWPTAFPPCAPPTVPRPCSRTSSVLCSRSTPRRRA